MIKVFTIGQVAKICKVAPRTVNKWFDSGRLKGFRVPGSLDRRVPRGALLYFMREHGMSLDELDKEETKKRLFAELDAELETVRKEREVGCSNDSKIIGSYLDNV